MLEDLDPPKNHEDSMDMDNGSKHANQASGKDPMEMNANLENGNQGELTNNFNIINDTNIDSMQDKMNYDSIDKNVDETVSHKLDVGPWNLVTAKGKRASPKQPPSNPSMQTVINDNRNTTTAERQHPTQHFSQITRYDALHDDMSENSLQATTMTQPQAKVVSAPAPTKEKQSVQRVRDSKAGKNSQRG